MLKRIAVALIATTLFAAPAFAAGENGNPSPATPAATTGGSAPTTATTGHKAKVSMHKKGHRHIVRHSKHPRHYAHVRSHKLAKHVAKPAKMHKVRVSHRGITNSKSATRSGT